MGFRLNGGSIQFQLLRSLNLISSKNCAVEWKWLCKEMGKPLNWVGAWWMFQTLPFSVHSLRAAFHKDVRLLLGSGSDAPINNWWLISRCSRSNGLASLNMQIYWLPPLEANWYIFLNPMLTFCFKWMNEETHLHLEDKNKCVTCDKARSSRRANVCR